MGKGVVPPSRRIVPIFRGPDVLRDIGIVADVIASVYVWLLFMINLFYESFRWAFNSFVWKPIEKII